MELVERRVHPVDPPHRLLLLPPRVGQRVQHRDVGADAVPGVRGLVLDEVHPGLLLDGDGVVTVPVPLPVSPSQTLADASQGLELVVVRVEHEGSRMAPQNAFHGLLPRRVVQHEAPLDPAEVTGIRHRPGLERVPSSPRHLGVPLRVV